MDDRQCGEIAARLRAAILDIDAHATPLGEDEDGFVAGGYLISIGSLHRALGIIGHTAPPCRLCGPTSGNCAEQVVLLRDIASAADGVLESFALWKQTGDTGAAAHLDYWEHLISEARRLSGEDRHSGSRAPES